MLTLVRTELLLVSSLEGTVKSAAVWKIFGVPSLLSMFTPRCMAWVGVWFGPTVHMCTMRSAKSTVSEVILVSGIIMLPRAKRGRDCW